MCQFLNELNRRSILGELYKIQALELPHADWDNGCWDLYYANGIRTRRYCQVYAKKELSNDLKFALMALIIASYANLLAEHPGKESYKSYLWGIISNQLHNDRAIHALIVEHWCNFENSDLTEHALRYQKCPSYPDPELIFKFDTERVTALMRSFAANR